MAKKKRPKLTREQQKNFEAWLRESGRAHIAYVPEGEEKVAHRGSPDEGLVRQWLNEAHLFDAIEYESDDDEGPEDANNDGSVPTGTWRDLFAGIDKDAGLYVAIAMVLGLVALMWFW